MELSAKEVRKKLEIYVSLDSAYWRLREYLSGGKDRLKMYTVMLIPYTLLSLIVAPMTSVPILVMGALGGLGILFYLGALWFGFFRTESLRRKIERGERISNRSSLQRMRISAHRLSLHIQVFEACVEKYCRYLRLCELGVISRLPEEEQMFLQLSAVHGQLERAVEILELEDKDQGSEDVLRMLTTPVSTLGLDGVGERLRVNTTIIDAATPEELAALREVEAVCETVCAENASDSKKLHA